MAYNKARAEKKWLKWKEAEEKKLRELGVDEETIQRLHTYDWAEFNRERRYLQRQVEWSPYVDLVSAQDLELPVEDVESLLDSIEDMELLRILSKEDKHTIQIAFLKMSGYNGYEIAEKTGLTQKAVNLRMPPARCTGKACRRRIFMNSALCSQRRSISLRRRTCGKSSGL